MCWNFEGQQCGIKIGTQGNLSHDISSDSFESDNLWEHTYFTLVYDDSNIEGFIIYVIINALDHMQVMSRPLPWSHNECDGVSNHQPHDCLRNRLFRRRSKKTAKLRVTDLREGNSLVTGEFPAQRASDTEYVSIWWRHHGITQIHNKKRTQMCFYRTIQHTKGLEAHMWCWTGSSMVQAMACRHFGHMRLTEPVMTCSQLNR